MMKFEKLGNIADIIAGQSPPSSTYNSEGKGIPFFQGKADYGEKYPSVRYWCTEPTKISLPNDILISMRAPVGPVNINIVESCIGRGLSAIRVKNNVSRDFIYFWLKQNQHIIAAKETGSTFKAITQKILNEIVVPFPSYPDQLHIANLLSKAETLIAQRKESIRLLDEFLKSTFLEMFYNNSEIENWDEVKFEELAEKKKASMRSGPFGSSLLHGEFTETGDVKVLGIDNVVSNRFTWKRSRCITNEKFKELKRYQVFPNDVLISIMATLGRTAVVPNDIPLCINSKHLAAITLDKKIANPYFVAYAFHSHPLIVRQMTNNVKGAIMDGLNLTIIRKIKMKLPPVELQNMFGETFEKSEALKTQYQQSLQELENLYGSLSQRAFKGELSKKRIT
ncbi:MAG: restriction endonuclease subunit S [Bacteroidales bacterium]